jgi:uncharacterized paraquat-inducible protein A
MSVGSILVGVALALIVGAYLARPFRRAEVDPDQTIEAWVAQVRAETEAEDLPYCPQCGRRAGPDDRFCARCGARLRGGAR